MLKVVGNNSCVQNNFAYQGKCLELFLSLVDLESLMKENWAQHSDSRNRKAGIAIHTQSERLLRTFSES